MKSNFYAGWACTPINQNRVCATKLATLQLARSPCLLFVANELDEDSMATNISHVFLEKVIYFMR